MEEYIEDLNIGQEILQIEVIGARRLDIRHKKSGSSSPYCKFIWGEEYVTKTFEEELNPRWKQKFLINLIGSNLEIEVMKFEIWCQRTNTLLGEVSIPVAGHRDTKIKFAKEHWYPLGGGKLSSKRKEIVTDRSKRKKLDKKSLKYTGDICLKIGLQQDEEKVKKQVFAVTANSSIKIEDYQGLDIQELNQESEMLVAESNKTVKSVLIIAEQTRKIGIDSLGNLDSQGKNLQTLKKI